LRNVPASGVQVAILIFALVFLAWPLQKYLGPALGLEESPSKLVGKLFIFVPAIALLAGIPALRRFCVEALSTPIPAERRLELGGVTLAKLCVPFAIAGATVLWHYALGGEMTLARRLGEQRPAAEQIAAALRWDGIAMLCIAGLVAPVVEELVFRGLLYRAWERQWGWAASMLATSAVFAAYHPVPFAAFIGSVIFVLVLRRTGSLWAPIIVHATGNLALWPPLLGRFYFDTRGKETGEIELWSFHLGALALLAIALPAYAWLARDGRECADERGAQAAAG
jgi:membrane protease YdiL (CAAX protease family)